MLIMTSDANNQRYPNPPVVEAVMEIRFSTTVNNSKLRKAQDRLSKKYNNSKDELQTEVKVDFASRSAKFVDLGHQYRLTSEDQTNLCILTPTSVAWVRRAPYEGWQAFSDRLATEVPVALKTYGDPLVGRIGLRYVNRIDVPASNGVARHEDYLNFRISHGDLLEPTSGFQWLLVREFTDLGLKATVQSGVVEPEVPGFAAFSFDIDVFCDSNPPKSADEILTKLEIMRDLKNRIFEAGITAKAREAYS